MCDVNLFNMHHRAPATNRFLIIKSHKKPSHSFSICVFIFHPMSITCVPAMLSRRIIENNRKSTLLFMNMSERQASIVNN